MSVGVSGGAGGSGGGAFGHQQDPEKFMQAVMHIEGKALEVKSNIEQLLFMLDLQDKVPWPDMLDKFSSLASAMVQLQTMLRKSALPSGSEDYGVLLRTHLLVPHRLANDIDPLLQQATQNRLHYWNHDVAPEYLRTKLTPEMEADEGQIELEKTTRSSDWVNKQIQSMNKHVEALLTALGDSARSQADPYSDTPTYNNQDTQKLVRAVVNGDGLRPLRAPAPADSAQGTAAPAAAPGPLTNPSHITPRGAAAAAAAQQQPQAQQRR